MTATTSAIMTIAAELRFTAKYPQENHLISASQCKAVQEAQVARKYSEVAGNE
jgi:hypothetical protein